MEVGFVQITLIFAQAAPEASVGHPSLTFSTSVVVPPHFNLAEELRFVRAGV